MLASLMAMSYAFSVLERLHEEEGSVIIELEGLPLVGPVSLCSGRLRVSYSD